MKLTVFTPLYNRAIFLTRIYDSLMKQKYKDFEWLIVDDGSSDDPEKTINELIKNANFSIRYLKKENGGKHTAHNLAVENAHGEWFMCLDSDDILVDGALLSFFEASDNKKNDVSVMTAYKQADDGNLLCDRVLPEDKGKGIYTLLNDRHGEYVFFFKTSLVKKYPYPVFEGEKFSSECIMYDRLELEGYKIDCIDSVIQECEYQQEGLSNNFRKLLVKNPCCFQIVHMQRIELAKKTSQRFIHCIKYCAFRILGKFKAPKYTGNHKFTVFCAYPFGIFASLYYKIR